MAEAPAKAPRAVDTRTAEQRQIDVNLIVDAILASGLSARRFAEWITWRDERTIRRWSSGFVPIPESAKRRLEWFLGISDARRRTFVDILLNSKVTAPGESEEP